MGKKVQRTRNNKTMTEAAYWGHVRSVLRRGFRYWKPLQEAKKAARVPYEGPNNRRKWSFVCACCGGHFQDKDIQVDHIEPVGSLKSYDDLPGFVERLSAESGYQVLCKPCHKEKTLKEREYRIK